MYRLIIFGFGFTAAIIENIVDLNHASIVAYADNDQQKINKSFKGRKIIHPSEIYQYEFDYILIANSFYVEIREQLINLTIPSEKILCPIFYDEVREKLIKLSHNPQIETFITGMSYSKFGINENALGVPTANLSFISQDLFFDYCIARYVLLNFKNRFKYAVIGLASYSFEYNLLHARENAYAIRYECLRAGLAELPFNEVSQYEKLLENSWMNSTADKQIYKAIFIRSYSEDIKEHNFRQIKSSMERRKSLALQHSLKNYPNTVLQNIKILKAYLYMLRLFNIKPILLVHPQHKDYRQYFSSRIRTEFIQILNELKRTEDFIWLDLFSSEQFFDEDFLDDHHLNEHGAATLSSILNQSMND